MAGQWLSTVCIGQHRWGHRTIAVLSSDKHWPTALEHCLALLESLWLKHIVVTGRSGVLNSVLDHCQALFYDPFTASVEIMWSLGSVLLRSPQSEASNYLAVRYTCICYRYCATVSLDDSIFNITDSIFSILVFLSRVENHSWWKLSFKLTCSKQEILSKLSVRREFVNYVMYLGTSSVSRSWGLAWSPVFPLVSYHVKVSGFWWDKRVRKTLPTPGTFHMGVCLIRPKALKL